MIACPQVPPSSLSSDSASDLPVLFMTEPHQAFPGPLLAELEIHSIVSGPLPPGS